MRRSYPLTALRLHKGAGERQYQGMNRLERVLLWGGAIVGWGKTLLKLANTLIGLGGVPGDLAGWAAFFGKVVGGYKMLDWTLLVVGTACLAFALSSNLRRLFGIEKPLPQLPLPVPEETGEKAAGFVAPGLRLQGRAERNPEPDMLLAELVARVRQHIEPPPLWNYSLKESDRRIDLTIADKVVVKNLHVWGRSGNTALSPLHPQTLRTGTFNHQKGTWTAVSDWGVRDITDLHFSRAEIDKIWPKRPESEDPIIKPTPSPIAVEGKRPPLTDRERGFCRQALFVTRNFLTGDLASLHASLVEARNSENLSKLKPISPFAIKAAHAFSAARQIENDQWTWLHRMGDVDLKPLIEALKELRGKIDVVKQGIDRGFYQDALMDTVTPMHEKNLEVGKLGQNLIQWADEMQAEYFGG